MLDITIYESADLVLRLSWLGLGRSSVAIKSRGLTIKALPEEHRYFQDCMAAFSAAGVTSPAADPRLRGYFEEYGSVLGMRGLGRWKAFFSTPIDIQVASHMGTAR